MGFLVFLPLAAIFGGIVLLVMGVVRAIRKKQCKRTILIGAALLVPLAVLGLFYLIGALGIGPVPN